MHEGPTRARRPPRVVRYAKTRVAVTRGPDTGLTIDVAGASLRIGSSEESDLVLRDDTVSRRHCEIEVVAEGTRVRDVGSTNGVFWGALRLYDAILPGEVTLTLGDTELSVTPLTETIDREQVDGDRFGDALGKS